MLESHIEKIRNQGPVKCQGCECYEAAFKDGWFWRCTESKCYQDKTVSQEQTRGN